MEVWHQRKRGYPDMKKRGAWTSQHEGNLIKLVGCRPLVDTGVAIGNDSRH